MANGNEQFVLEKNVEIKKIENIPIWIEKSEKILVYKKMKLLN